MTQPPKILARLIGAGEKLWVRRITLGLAFLLHLLSGILLVIGRQESSFSTHLTIVAAASLIPVIFFSQNWRELLWRALLAASPTPVAMPLMLFYVKVTLVWRSQDSFSLVDLGHYALIFVGVYLAVFSILWHFLLATVVLRYLCRLWIRDTGPNGADTL